MTIAREEPGLIIAVCDCCGDRKTVDLDEDATPEEIAEALIVDGWEQRTPERVKFRNLEGSQTIAFDQDYCWDCRSGEPRPHPKFGSGRKVIIVMRDGFVNDPCDEWPRALVFAAVGLRATCGHPVGGDPRCSYCLAGYAPGSARPSWQR